MHAQPNHLSGAGQSALGQLSALTRFFGGLEDRSLRTCSAPRPIEDWSDDDSDYSAGSPQKEPSIIVPSPATKSNKNCQTMQQCQRALFKSRSPPHCRRLALCGLSDERGPDYGEPDDVIVERIAHSIGSRKHAVDWVGQLDWQQDSSKSGSSSDDTEDCFDFSNFATALNGAQQFVSAQPNDECSDECSDENHDSNSFLIFGFEP